MTITIPLTCREIKIMVFVGWCSMVSLPFVFDLSNSIFGLVFVLGMMGVLVQGVIQLSDWYWDDKIPEFKCRCDNK